MTFDKKKYDQKYVKDNYARIPLNVKKADKDLIISRAKEKGFSNVTEYIKDLIYKDLKSESRRNVNIENVIQNGDNNSINVN